MTAARVDCSYLSVESAAAAAAAHDDDDNRQRIQASSTTSSSQAASAARSFRRDASTATRNARPLIRLHAVFITHTALQWRRRHLEENLRAQLKF